MRTSITNLEVPQDGKDFQPVLHELFLVLLGDFQGTRESDMGEVGVEGSSDLFGVVLHECLGPCSDDLDLGALLSSRRHG